MGEENLCRLGGPAEDFDAAVIDAGRIDARIHADVYGSELHAVGDASLDQRIHSLSIAFVQLLGEV